MMTPRVYTNFLKYCGACGARAKGTRPVAPYPVNDRDALAYTLCKLCMRQLGPFGLPLEMLAAIGVRMEKAAIGLGLISPTVEGDHAPN